MKKETANLALQFLQRIELKPQEIQAYMAVCNELSIDAGLDQGNVSPIEPGLPGADGQQAEAS